MNRAIGAMVDSHSQRSLHLLEGLKAALLVSGQKDFARIAELAMDDVICVITTLQLRRERDHRTRQNAALQDIQTLARLAGGPSTPAAIRARRVIARM